MSRVSNHAKMETDQANGAWRRKTVKALHNGG